MPGMYAGEDYDLAGFCVGVVEKEAIIDGTRVQPGDAVIGLASSGPHSNGYSLIRKLIAVGQASAATQLAGESLYEQLLKPTRIYVKSLLALMRLMSVHALAHITGGGLSENIPRSLRAGLEVVLERRAWPRQPVFEWLARTGAIEEAEMHRTFNCGIGMIVIVEPERAEEAMRVLGEHGEHALLLGEVRRGDRGVVIVSER
jgi:phosphoribosylformylglycinamidine cyclo-ligase